jgi:phospholipase C
MTRSTNRTWFRVSIAFFWALLCAIAPAQQPAQRPLDLSSIQHFVFIVKENRSFDNYFGAFEPPPYGATTGLLSSGQVIPLGRSPDLSPRDLGHDWANTLVAMNNGKMDSFDLIGVLMRSGLCNVDQDYLCYAQFTQHDIPNYWAYAQNFVLADQNFSAIHADSFPAHLYTVAAQSGGVISNPTNRGVGCDTPDATVVVIDPQGYVSDQFPCFTFATLADSLSAAQISWKVLCGWTFHMESSGCRRQHSPVRPLAKCRAYLRIHHGRHERDSAVSQLDGGRECLYGASRTECLQR